MRSAVPTMLPFGSVSEYLFDVKARLRRGFLHRRTSRTADSIDEATAPPESAVVPESSPPLQGLTLVFGRSSGGAASLVSTIAVAYQLASSPLAYGAASSLTFFYEGNGDLGVSSCSSSARAGSGVHTSFAVPVCLQKRKDFRLLSDAQTLFFDAGLTFDAHGAPKALLFWEDVDWAAVARQHPNARVVLVDHNVMSEGVLAQKLGEVSLIVDHHVDEGQHCRAQRCIDTTVASTCALVLEAFKTDGLRIPSDLGTLMLGALLMDTFNLESGIVRQNSREEAAVAALEDFCPKAESVTGVSRRTNWYRKLALQNYDVAGQPPNYVLRCSLVGWEQISCASLKVGFIAIPLTLEEFCRDGVDLALTNLQDVAEEKQVDIVVSLLRSSSFQGLIITPFRDRKVPDSKLQAKELIALEKVDTIIQYLLGTPSSLPDKLRDTNLFIAQGLSARGFQLQPCSEDFSPLRAFRCRLAVTRNTLMQAIVALLSGVAQMPAVLARQTSVKPFVC